MLFNNNHYIEIMTEIKTKIKEAQFKAALNINHEMIILYWNIGNIINENSIWGNKFIENLERDIKSELPNSTGYSSRNLKYMAKFASEYEDLEFVQQLVAQIPWGHNIVLLDKIKDIDTRKWYIENSIKNGWSRSVLVHQIELKIYERQVLSDKTTNFNNILSSPQSELAIQTIKDPYIFDFIDMKREMVEREIEDELVKNITKLLLELGTGFAFIGNQYHLEVGGEDFYIDLLFYNLNLRCYVIVELKTGSFKPEYAGKLNFYLSAIDSLIKKDIDNPSIGLLLCKDKNKLIAEYALKDISKPIGVSEYRLMDILPKDFENTLPSTEDIEKRIKFDMGDVDNEI
ncbi:MAG: PDDEXK nuclease domain-containing protein [Saccharofermentanales bacterium]